MTNTAFDCLDPELELEAQQLANYEDKLREEAEQRALEDKIWDEEMKLHHEEIGRWKDAVDEIIANEECNRQGIPLKKYSIENFRPGKLYQSLNEDWEDDWCSIVSCFEYWPMFWDFRIAINEYSWWWRSLFIRMKKDWFDLDMSKHHFKDYQQAIDCLNSIAPFIYDLAKWNIQ